MRERAAIHLAVMGAGDLWTLSSDGAVGFSLTRSEYSIRGVIVIGLLVIRAGHARSNSEGDVQNVEISWWGPWGTERGSNLWGARATRHNFHGRSSSRQLHNLNKTIH
jgi:hypothetical protein